MKPIVVLGMAQPYPGYDYEQVTIVASRIPDTIVAFGQTRHNKSNPLTFLWKSISGTSFPIETQDVVLSNRNSGCCL
jgi:hypothetical protein